MKKENKIRQQLIVEKAMTNQDSDKTWNNLGKVLGEEVLQRLKERKAINMRLGKVCITHHYVVDLDNEEMVDGAKLELYEDIKNGFEYSWMDIVEDSSLSESDIPEFLKNTDGIEEN